MHPAWSVIIFTTLTGLGYGLANIGYVYTIILGEMPEFMPIILFVAYFMVGLGLLSSLFHLGHWKRAWRALSQWRTSWLSREGVLSLLAFIPPFVIIFLPLEFLNYAFSWLGVILNLMVILATSMIYASLKPIIAWCNPLVPALFQLSSFVSGLLAYQAIVGQHNKFIAWAVLLVLLVHVVYWFILGKLHSTTTIETATGLHTLGKNIRVYDAPHDGDNYLNKEMGYQIARSNSQNIKLIIIGLFLWSALAIYFQKFQGGFIGFISFIVAILLARWLFFAEAKHVVNTYYKNGE